MASLTVRVDPLTLDGRKKIYNTFPYIELEYTFVSVILYYRVAKYH